MRFSSHPYIPDVVRWAVITDDKIDRGSLCMLLMTVMLVLYVLNFAYIVLLCIHIQLKIKDAITV
jgi:hypothetical protein